MMKRKSVNRNSVGPTANRAVYIYLSLISSNWNCSKCLFASGARNGFSIDHMVGHGTVPGLWNFVGKQMG